VLNFPLEPADYTYGSWLFDFSPKYPCDVQGGPGYDPSIRLNGFEDMKPDYDLFPIDYSLGYTWEYCPRKCKFCVVPKQNNPMVHRSIWAFHDTRFDKICLLNNNTFSDPLWRKTFEEIWAARLTVVDENGYDLRLMDEEKADALKRTRFDGSIHFAWDLMRDERAIRKGLTLAKQHKLNGVVYVLVGFNTIEEDDIYRCQVITNMGFDPYIMPYRSRKKPIPPRRLLDFKRFIDSRYYRQTTIAQAWTNYRP